MIRNTNLSASFYLLCFVYLTGSSSVNSQRLFSDEQLRVIYDACQFSLGEAALSIPEEKQLNAVSRQIESLFPALEQHEQQSGIEQTM